MGGFVSRVLDTLHAYLHRRRLRRWAKKNNLTVRWKDGGNT